MLKNESFRVRKLQLPVLSYLFNSTGELKNLPFKTRQGFWLCRGESGHVSKLSTKLYLVDFLTVRRLMHTYVIIDHSFYSSIFFDKFYTTVTLRITLYSVDYDFDA